MARIRTIKPAFWTDEKLAQLEPVVRLTFLGLISAMADDGGRCKADPRLVKAAVWPLDDDIRCADVAQHLDDLERVGRVLRYTVDGATYLEIVNWSRHQRIDKPRKSELPPPPTVTNTSGSVVDISTKLPRSIQEPSALEAEREVEEEWNGSGAEEAPSAAPPGPLVSVLALPKGCIDFMAMFYEPALTHAQRERYRDVSSQLWDALDDKHPGPKIRGGIRVKARSAEHLEQECRNVMRDPPRDRDKAVVIVLKRLTDPPKGPTPAEIHKAETDATIGEENAYQAEARSVCARWARDHPDEYAPILAAVDAEFRSAPSSTFTKMARDASLAQRCARAAGFPDFDTWRTQRQGAVA